MPDAAEIRAALEKLIASPTFSKSPQLAHFIKFVVEETLAGRADRIKAYTIAADALGRGADFDAQNNPLVRVEAGRLRHALDQYYATHGRDDPITIELPRGHYVPVFRPNTAPRRAVTRMRELRRSLIDIINGNFRLVILILVIAAVVSISFDIIFMKWMTANWRE